MVTECVKYSDLLFACSRNSIGNSLPSHWVHEHTLKLLQEHNYSGNRRVHHPSLGEWCVQINSVLCSQISNFKSVEEPTETCRVIRAAVYTQLPSQHHQNMQVSPSYMGFGVTESWVSSLDLSFMIFVLLLEPSFSSMCVYMCVLEYTYKNIFKYICTCIIEVL